MAEVLHYGPRDLDALTVEEFDAAVRYVQAWQDAHRKAVASEPSPRV